MNISLSPHNAFYFPNTAPAGDRLTEPDPATDSDDSQTRPAGVAEDASRQGISGQVLTEQEQAEVENLEKRDREVRQHEQAHVAAGGQYVGGGIHYEYENGPDGSRYAVGGHVSIDTAAVKEDPGATIQKAQTIRRAALAPANPSPQDRQVAAAASQMETRARQDLMQEQQNQLSSLSTDQASQPHGASQAERSNEIEPAETITPTTGMQRLTLQMAYAPAARPETMFSVFA